MQKKINVLIDGLGGDVGQGVAKALMMSTLPITIFGACISSSSSWLHKIEHSYIFPYINDAKFISFLIDFINYHNIDIYFPTIDSGIKKISEYKKTIEEQTKCIVFVDQIEKVHICDDKYTTVKFLEKEGFSAPKSILPNEEEIDNFIESVGYPFIIKTRSGNGAKEVFLAKSYNDYAPYIGNENYMFQEYIPSEGGEYTSGIYLGDDGEVKGICTLERELRCGSTYKAKRIDNEVLEEPLKKIATSLGMKYLNIQSMRKGDILYPFEFNGRFSGTTGIISKVFNAPEMFIKEKVLNELLPVNQNNHLFYVMRYFEEVYVSAQEVEALEKRSKELI